MLWAEVLIGPLRALVEKSLRWMPAYGKGGLRVFLFITSVVRPEAAMILRDFESK